MILIQLPLRYWSSQIALLLSLERLKGKYGYESWTELVAKKPRKEDKKDDPQSSIMDMMKDLYETGDDNMRKIIG
jgi:calcyclin binding protein